MENKTPLVVLTGPTAVGKTALSLQLARRIGAEIISADSMQVYRGLDIGSAKIAREEMAGIPHHLIDVLDPDEPFDVVRFQALAKESIRKIRENGFCPGGGRNAEHTPLPLVIDGILLQIRHHFQIG